MWNRKPWYERKATEQRERKTCKWYVISVEMFDGGLTYTNGQLEFTTRKKYRPCSKFNIPRGAVVESMELTKEDAYACAKVLNNIER